MRRLLVLCMRHWGGLGNFVWGHRIKAQLSSTEAEVDLWCADQPGTLFARAADDLRQARARMSHDAEHVHDAYLAWAARTLQELEESASPWPLGAAPEALQRGAYDAVVCTKGVLVRWLQRCAHASCVPAPTRLVSFVTNPGLTQLALHVPTIAPFATILPDAGWTEYLATPPARRGRLLHWSPAPLDAHGAPAAPLPEAVERALAETSLERPLVVAVANGDGRRWTSFCERVTRALPRARVLFLCVGDGALLGEVGQVLARAPSRGHVVLPSLEEQSAQQLLAKLGALGACVVVTKPGPSTFSGLRRHRVPMVLWDAGLPPERWLLSEAAKLPRARGARSLDEAVARTIELTDAPVESTPRAMSTTASSLGAPLTSEQLVERLCARGDASWT